jgi:hypothetical protein
MNRRDRRRQARQLPPSIRALVGRMCCPDCNSDITKPVFDGTIWRVALLHDESCPYYRRMVKLHG